MVCIWNLAKPIAVLFLQEKEDGVYVKEEDVEYLKKHWEADEYSYFLQSSTLVPKVKAI